MAEKSGEGTLFVPPIERGGKLIKTVALDKILTTIPLENLLFICEMCHTQMETFEALHEHITAHKVQLLLFRMAMVTEAQDGADPVLNSPLNLNSHPALDPTLDLFNPVVAMAHVLEAEPVQPPTFIPPPVNPAHKKRSGGNGDGNGKKRRPGEKRKKRHSIWRMGSVQKSSQTVSRVQANVGSLPASSSSSSASSSLSILRPIEYMRTEEYSQNNCSSSSNSNSNACNLPSSSLVESHQVYQTPQIRPSPPSKSVPKSVSKIVSKSISKAISKCRRHSNRPEAVKQKKKEKIKKRRIYFVCEVCDAKFATPTHLLDHQHTCHGFSLSKQNSSHVNGDNNTTTGGCPPWCRQCDWTSFDARDSFNRHQTHTEQHPRTITLN